MDVAPAAPQDVAVKPLTSIGRILGLTLLAGIATEATTMWLLKRFINHPVTWQEIAVDLAATVLIVFPVIMIGMLRPLLREMAARREALLALRAAEASLEIRLDERTGQLDAANRYLRAEIVERQHYEAALIEANASLLEREMRLGLLLNQLPAIVWSTDMELRLTSAAGAGLLPLKITPEQVLGMDFPELTAQLGFDNLMLKEYRQVLKGKATQFEAQRGEFVYECFVEPFLDSAGEVIGTLGLALDVTSQVKAERQIRLQSMALEASANGIIITDTQGRILWANRAFAAMTGYEIAEVSGQTPQFLKSGLQEGQFYRTLWDTILQGYVWRGEVVNRRKDGSFYVEDETITPVLDRSGKVSHYIAIKLDITERRQAEEAVRKQNEELTLLYVAESRARQVAETLRQASLALTENLELRSVLDTLLDYLCRLIPYDGAGVVLLEDQDQLRVYLNRGSDCEVETVAHLPFAIQPDSLYAHLLRENESVIIHNWDEEWPHLARIGSPHARSWLAVPLTAAHQAMGFCFLEKEQTEAFTPAQMYLAEALAGQASVAIQNAWLFEQVRGGQERFQNLSRRLVEVQEGERRYIARELHDEAGQALASISVRLDLLEQHAHDPQVVTEAVAGLHAAVDDVLTGLHRMAMNLRPASLDHLGLAVSLEQYLKSFSELQRLKVNFASIGEDLGRLNPEVEINLYRIVQEALANVAMHAQATQVDVLLKLDRAAPEPRLVLLIEDNGRGFDPHEAEAGERLGIVGMRERAEMMGGALVVESSPGRGTTVQIDIPFLAAKSDLPENFPSGGV